MKTVNKREQSEPADSTASVDRCPLDQSGKAMMGAGKAFRPAGNTVSITFGPKLEGGRKKDESQITNGFNMRFLAIKLNQTKSNQIKLLYFPDLADALVNLNPKIKVN